ncbi:MAG: class II fructose-bisphosphatase [Hellea sp.]|nr:class II fructose-bisphosphatase [Hellea sp.]
MSRSGFNKMLALKAAFVTESAAIASYHWIGRGNEKAADKAAVDAMRNELNKINIDGEIVIGEGERDEAPMLFIGEKVGTGVGPKIDIALDPLEGTTLTAKNMANALAVMAFSPSGRMLNAPDTYMDKIAIGPGYAPGIINLDNSPTDNILALSSAKGVKPSEITVCVMDRDRHKDLINELRNLDVKISLSTDGDVQGIIATTNPSTNIDIYIGRGGAPEGVLAAAALRCVGGQMEGRLHFRNEVEIVRARKVGIDDLDKKYNLDGLASGPAIFSATGVTTGSLLDGVRLDSNYVSTHTLIMNSIDASVQKLRSHRPI